MSELQIGLLAIGALVVVGVLAYNRVQERGAKRAAQLSFRSGHADVLMEQPVPAAERNLLQETQRPSVRAAPPDDAAQPDPKVDYIVELSVEPPAMRPDAQSALKTQWSARSMDDVLERLLKGPAKSATALFKERHDAVRRVLRKHGVKRLVAFGSRARGEGRPDSDLDLAGSLPHGADLFDLVHVKDDLAAAFGVPVDFVTFDGARPRLREEIDAGVVLVG